MDRDKNKYFQQLKIEKINDIISIFIKIRSRVHLLTEYLIPLTNVAEYDLNSYADDLLQNNNDLIGSYKKIYDKSLMIISKIESFNNEFIIFKSNLTFLKVYIRELDEKLEHVIAELDELIKMNYKIIERIEKIYQLEKHEDGIKDLIDLDKLSALLDKISSVEKLTIELLQTEIYK